MSDPIAGLRAAIDGVVAELRDGRAAGERPGLERPPKAELGDYSTNAAMLLAPVVDAPPKEIAADLAEELSSRLGGAAERVEVAGPGFLNVFLSDRWYRDAVTGILDAGERFGRSEPRAGERISVEFVSANPTGPLTVAGGRHAAYGDSLARCLEAVGYDVEREYYLNDAGGQIRLFAESIAARMGGDAVPDGGYEGAYVSELAEQLAAEGLGPGDLDRLASRGPELMRGEIEATLERYGVSFDIWFSERSLHDRGLVDDALAALGEDGHVYESEGAVWLRTTAFGDDKDRVLVRSDGEPTYLAADVAYHRDKIERGATRLINVLGADHHGYVPRLRAALEALGFDPDRFEAPIMQLVNLLERGERAQMSKRKGEFATLEELIDDVGTDAARFFLLQRSHDTAVDLDLELARSQSSENPVYYVQYAHARIASILRKAGPERIDRVGAKHEGDPFPTEASERALIKRLLELPSELELAAERRAPHRLTAYAMGTAADFHGFYRDCQVVDAPGGAEAARIGVCLATKTVIATTLGLLGVSSPESM